MSQIWDKTKRHPEGRMPLLFEGGAELAGASRTSNR